MKAKILLIAFALLILLTPSVLAQSQGASGTGSGQGASDGSTGNASGETVGTNQGTNNQGEGSSLTVNQRTELKARNATELGQMVRDREQEMNKEMENFSQAQKNVLQNQNRVRLAVHSLLAMENLTGGIGPQVSQIAREFNNSVQSTIRSEEKIQTRDGFSRFFFGGDEVAAGEIEGEVAQNQQRIQNLTRLRDECSCGEDVKAAFQEQIQNLEMEQTRLQQLAASEKASKGLLGWMWK